MTTFPEKYRFNKRMAVASAWIMVHRARKLRLSGAPHQQVAVSIAHAMSWAREALLS